MHNTFRTSLLAAAISAACAIPLGAQAQTAGTSAGSTTENKAMAAGRHADGGTGVRKAESTTTTDTSGSAASGSGGSTGISAYIRIKLCIS